MSGLVIENFQRLARSFLAGILAVLPVVITVAIVAWVAGFVRQILGPGTLIGEGLTGLGLRFVTNDTVAYLIGGLLVLGCVLLIGIAVEAGAKNLVQRLLDVAMRRIPIISSIYGTSKQLVTLFEKKDPEKLQGMKAVFCFFGEKTGAGILALLVSPEQYLHQRAQLPYCHRAHGPRAHRRRTVLHSRGNGPADRRERRGADEHLCLDGRQRPAVPAGNHGSRRPGRSCGAARSIDQFFLDFFQRLALGFRQAAEDIEEARDANRRIQPEYAGHAQQLLRVEGPPSRHRNTPHAQSVGK